MWSRAAHLSDAELTSFKDDLIRSAPTSYGVIILGKIRIPAINVEKGEGFGHVRIHDPPNRGDEDVRFHRRNKTRRRTPSDCILCYSNPSILDYT